MAGRSVTMYIDTVPNRSSPPAILLREGWREGGKVKKRTIANLSKWPPAKIEALRRVLKNQTLVAPEDAFRHRPLQPPRPCRGRARQPARPRARAPDRRQALAPARPGGGHDRGPHPRPALQAGHRARSVRRHAEPQPGRGAGAGRGRRRRALCGDGLVAGTPGVDRAAPGQASSRRRRPGALRRQLDLDGGPLLPAGAPRLRPRRQARQGADRLRPAVQRRGLPGGGRGLRGRHGRSGHPGRADRQAAHPLRAHPGGPGGRPRPAHQRAHSARRWSRPGSTGSAPCARRRSGNWLRAGRCNPRCSTSATWPRSIIRTSPASA